MDSERRVEGHWLWPAVIGVALALAVAGGACGGDDDAGTAASGGGGGSGSATETDTGPSRIGRAPRYESEQKAFLREAEPVTGTEAEEIETTVRDYIAAVVAKDAETVCELANKTLTERLLLMGAETQAGGCADRIAVALDRQDDRTIERTKLTAVQEVRMKGDRAVVFYTAPGGQRIAPLRREGGVWKVTGDNDKLRN